MLRADLLVDLRVDPWDLMGLRKAGMLVKWMVEPKVDQLVDQKVDQWVDWMVGLMVDLSED